MMSLSVPRAHAEDADGLSEEDAAAVLAAHEEALASGEGRIKDQRRTAVTRVLRGAECLCVKEYRSAGLWERAKDWFRGPRARRAWDGAQCLLARDIAVPEPLALVERPGASYLVSRFIEGAEPLERILEERFAGALGGQELAAKRAMVRQLGWWLRRVHDQGVYHDDWSAKNILVACEGGRWSFWFLDLESVWPSRRLTWRRRVKNLGQLSDAPFGISRTDRMRFLLAYADADAGLARGRFPRAVLDAARRRDEEWARVQERARKRKARMGRP